MIDIGRWNSIDVLWNFRFLIVFKNFIKGSLFVCFDLKSLIIRIKDIN